MAKVRETLYVEIAVSVEYDTDIVEDASATLGENCNYDITMPPGYGIRVCNTEMMKCE